MDTEYFDTVKDLLETAYFADPNTDITPLEEFFLQHPDKAEPYYLLSLAAYRLSDIPRAIVLCKKASELDTNCMEYCDALACFHTYVGNLSEGLYYAKLATACQPHEHVPGLLPIELTQYFRALKSAAPSRYYLNALLAFNMQNFEETLVECERELIVNPHNVDCIYLCARTNYILGKYQTVIENIKAATNLSKSKTTSRFLLLQGNTEFELGLIEDAIQTYSHALSDESLEVKEFISLSAAILGKIQHLPKKYSAARREFFNIFKASLSEEFSEQNDNIAPIEGRRINIGYISDHLYSCDDGQIASALFSSHNRNVFRIHVYQTNIREDILTRKLQTHVDTWVRAHDLEDDVLDLIIRNDRIDILIDLTGISEKRKNINLARHPAAIQVGWYNYLHKTEIPDIDYYIAGEDTATFDDAEIPGTTVSFPPGPFALENPMFIHQNKENAFERNGYFTYASEILLDRITNEHLQTWQSVLNQNPDNRLILTSVKPLSKDYLSRAETLLQIAGLTERVTLKYIPKNEMELVEHFSSIDFNVAVHNLERPLIVAYGISAGIPLISLKGIRRHERFAAAINLSVGRKDWVATNQEELNLILQSLGKDNTTYEQVSRQLIEDAAKAPMFNPKQYTTAIETLYLNLIERSQSST